MPVAVEDLSFIPTGYGGSNKRSLADWTGDAFINVKNFGALGDGYQDDTQYIQAAIVAAFGTSASPHGSNLSANRPLYFPPGHYIVSSPTNTLTISNVTVSGNPGTYTYTLNSIAGIVSGDTVYIDGVVMSNTDATSYGNGTRRVNVSGSTITTVDSYPSGTTATYSSGGKVRTSALKAWDVRNGRIFGASRGSVTIDNQTSGGITFQTDGFIYSQISGISFVGVGGAGSIGLLLDMRGAGGIVGSQGNEISNCGFGNTDIGVELFPTNLSQGSENVFINCFWQGNGVGSIGLRNGLNGVANALQQTIIGGDFQSWTLYGIYVPWGSIPIISGVGFQNQATPTAYDLKMDNSSWDAPVITGCRSESVNCFDFVHGKAVIIGCNQAQDTAGVFAHMATGGTIMNCISVKGQVSMPNGGTIIESEFGRSVVNHDWLYEYTNSPIYVRNVMVGNTWNGGGIDDHATVYGDGVFNGTGGVLKFVGDRVGTWVDFVIVYQTMAVADLPSPAAMWKGQTCSVRDSTVTTGDVVGHGGGPNQVLVWCNGSAWNVIGV